MPRCTTKVVVNVVKLVKHFRIRRQSNHLRDILFSSPEHDFLAAFFHFSLTVTLYSVISVMTTLLKTNKQSEALIFSTFVKVVNI